MSRPRSVKCPGHPECWWDVAVMPCPYHGAARVRLVPPPEPLDLPERKRPWWQDAIVTAVLVALFAWALWLMSRPARAQEPLPDLGTTLAELDRIERGILVHEIAVRDWRAAR